jgi:hypothetical protein
MTETNRLLRLTETDLAGSDLFRLFSQKYGGDAALTLTILKDYMDTQIGRDELVTQYSAPSATGFTVTISAVNTWLPLAPAAEYATGTIVLPAGVDRAEILVNTTQAVTALTVTPASGEFVTGAPTGLAQYGFFRLRFDEVADTWYRVG